MLVSGRVDIYEFKDLDLDMTPWFDGFTCKIMTCKFQNFDLDYVCLLKKSCCSFAGQAFCNTDVMTVTPNIRFITWYTPVDFDG